MGGWSGAFAAFSCSLTTARDEITMTNQAERPVLPLPVNETKEDQNEQPRRLSFLVLSES